MDRAASFDSTTAPVSHEAEIERALFALIADHADEPAPFILYLADRIASHEIVTRLRLVPVPVTFREPIARGWLGPETSRRHRRGRQRDRHFLQQTVCLIQWRSRYR